MSEQHPDHPEHDEHATVRAGYGEQANGYGEQSGYGEQAEYGDAASHQPHGAPDASEATQYTPVQPQLQDAPGSDDDQLVGLREGIPGEPAPYVESVYEDVAPEPQAPRAYQPPPPSELAPDPWLDGPSIGSTAAPEQPEVGEYAHPAWNPSASWPPEPYRSEFLSDEPPVGADTEAPAQAPIAQAPISQTPISQAPISESPFAEPGSVGPSAGIPEAAPPPYPPSDRDTGAVPVVPAYLPQAEYPPQGEYPSAPPEYAEPPQYLRQAGYAQPQAFPQHPTAEANSQPAPTTPREDAPRRAYQEPSPQSYAPPSYGAPPTAQQPNAPQGGYAAYPSSGPQPTAYPQPSHYAVPPADHPQSPVPTGQLGGPAQAQGAYGAGGFSGAALVPASSADLSASNLTKPKVDVPTTGWRRVVFKATAGTLNPGLSKDEIERKATIARIRTPVRGCHRIAVVSLKGGIGKTTTTSCLGLTLAQYRGDRVVAIDANPDAGTLAERLTGQVDISVRDLLDHIDDIKSFTDVSRYMSLAERLQVIASDQDPEVSEAFDADQYRAVCETLARYYNVVLTDSGTGMLHSAMAGTLALADSLVVVGAPSVDGASRAAKTLDWLNAHGHEDLVKRSVAVVSSVRPATGDVDMDVLRDHFASRCRAVVEIPYDPHLVVGGLIDIHQIKPATERAYLELAASVADGFAL